MLPRSLLCYSLLASVLKVQNTLTVVVYTWNERMPEDYTSVGRRLVGGVFETLDSHVSMVTQCALACLQRQKCLSYNFNYIHKVCELNNASHLDGGYNLAAVSSFRYYVRDAFTLQVEFAFCRKLHIFASVNFQVCISPIVCLGGVKYMY